MRPRGGGNKSSTATSSWTIYDDFRTFVSSVEWDREPCSYRMVASFTIRATRRRYHVTESWHFRRTDDLKITATWERARRHGCERLSLLDERNYKYRYDVYAFLKNERSQTVNIRNGTVNEKTCSHPVAIEIGYRISKSNHYSRLPNGAYCS